MRFDDICQKWYRVAKTTFPLLDYRKLNSISKPMRSLYKLVTKEGVILLLLKVESEISK